MKLFVATYETLCRGHSLGYTSNGSGAGISEFASGATDFGATDSPLTPDGDQWERAKARCGGNAPWNLPMVFGPIAITYNVLGLDSLVLDAPTIAKIFTGRVRTWDAPEIAALNQDRRLPRQDIEVFFRRDQSGTTENFQDYLEAAAGAAWDRGGGKAFKGGVGVGRNGNEGTSAAIARTPGSITYTEWSFAKEQGLAVAQIATGTGSDPVAPSVESATRLIAGVRIGGKGNDIALDPSSLRQSGRFGAYPIVLATYEVVCPTYTDGPTATAVREFLHVAAGAGQSGLADAGYVPVPDWLRVKLIAAIDAIE